MAAALILAINNTPPGAARDAQINTLDQMYRAIANNNNLVATILRAFGRWANATLPAPAPYDLVAPIVHEVNNHNADDHLINYLIAQANVYPLGNDRNRIVTALLSQTNRHTPARDILTDSLAHLASIYPPGAPQNAIIGALVRQAEYMHNNRDPVTRPQRTAILRALDSIVVGPPARNLVRNHVLGDLNHTHRYLLDTYLKTRGAHGAVIPVPLAAGNWRFVRCLGHGGEGTAHLYVSLNNRSQVADRVVQRNVVMDQITWNLPDIWEPNTPIGTNPKETWIMNMLPQSPNIIHLRNTVLDPANFTFVHYVDFVEHGNLWDLIAMHARTSRRNTSTPSSGQRGYRMDRSAPFDESFLWHLFRSLINGLVVMDNAAAQQPHPPPAAVHEIVHGDLHPGNVFLGAESAISFRLYPTPKIADFGFTQVSHANDPNNRDPAFDILRGHEDFRPPEVRGNAGQGQFDHFATPAIVKILAKANIYQVGLIMVCAMRLQNVPVPVINPYVPNVHDANHTWALPDNHLTTNYTPALANLVHSCLAYHPNNRPTATALLPQINAQGAAHFGPGTAETVGVGPGLPKPSLDPRTVRCGLRDQYRIGLRYPPPRPRSRG